MSACSATGAGSVVVPFPGRRVARPDIESAEGAVGLWLASAMAAVAAHAALALAILS